MCDWLRRNGPHHTPSLSPPFPPFTESVNLHRFRPHFSKPHASPIGKIGWQWRGVGTEWVYRPHSVNP
ncbi:hypothetical protein HanHA300_Chr15g0552791 [Helianthus annuus]|nr:hypothetical protein HanHA300_Chr15g0552791 [Helianthus annuus]KAJ0647501.1 hypothetical protein HanLR1_Chr15g0562531 [Helianthus annuus]KAJ0651379.1 hypothetical protein HanOQP8_Chr15g0560341 [Helianthus annuus]